jgi:hypothetical protein
MIEYNNTTGATKGRSILARNNTGGSVFFPKSEIF